LIAALLAAAVQQWLIAAAVDIIDMYNILLDEFKIENFQYGNRDR